MPRSGPLTLAVARALRGAQTQPQDAAAVALAKRYAELMDSAQELADAAGLIEPEDQSQARRLQVLAVKVDAQAVVSDLGPKLLAVLAALGMTVTARGAKTSGGGGAVVPGTSKLDELKARRASRANRAASVDSSAP